MRHKMSSRLILAVVILGNFLPGTSEVVAQESVSRAALQNRLAKFYSGAFPSEVHGRVEG